jgi:hypothetical protein
LNIFLWLTYGYLQCTGYEDIASLLIFPPTCHCRSPQHFIPKHLQFLFFHQCDRPSFKPR